MQWRRDVEIRLPAPTYQRSGAELPHDASGTAERSTLRKARRRWLARYGAEDAARRPEGPRRGGDPEEHERHDHLRRRLAHSGVRECRPDEIERDVGIDMIADPEQLRRLNLAILNG
jgi:hypothetical protein